MIEQKPVRIARVEYFHRLTHRLQNRLPVWVVYDRGTFEYPNHFVARMHVALPEPRPTRFVITHDSLDGLRRLLAPWLTRLERSASDPPEIVETWL